MESAFFTAGFMFFIFGGAMLAGIHGSLSKIEKSIERLSPETKED